MRIVLILTVILFDSVCFANHIDFSNKYPESIPEIISSDIIYNKSDILKEEEFLPRFDIRRLLVFDTFGFRNFFFVNASFAFLIANAAAELFQGEKIANLKTSKKIYRIKKSD